MPGLGGCVNRRPSLLGALANRMRELVLTALCRQTVLANLTDPGAN